ncbi:MAG: hypothetical protein WCC04_10925 [Terriglobales bacterium]
MQHQRTNFVGEAFVEFVVPDQEAHIDRPVERVEDEVEVAAGGQFVAVDATLQSLISLLASRLQESLAKGLDQLRIRLPSSEQRRHGLAALGPEDANQLPHLEAQVALHGAGVREAEFVVGAG